MPIQSTITAGCVAIDAMRDELAEARRVRVSEVGETIVAAEEAVGMARAALEGERKGLSTAQRIGKAEYIVNALGRVEDAEASLALAEWHLVDVQTEARNAMFRRAFA